MRRILAGLLLAAALAGCGGGGDGSTAATAGPPLSRDAWLSAVDELCAEANEDAAGLYETLTDAASPDEVADLLRDTLELQRQFNRDYERLTPPTELAQDAATIRAWNEAAVGLAERMIDALERDDQEALGAVLAEAEQLGAASLDRSRRMGLDECARDPFGDTLR